MLKRAISSVLAMLMLVLCGCTAANGTDGAQQQDASKAQLSEEGAQADFSGELNVYCFSAGKADAILLWTSDSAVLIDTGESGFGKEIVSYMQEQGIEALDYLILTHFDKDHVGGAAKLLSTVQVGQVLQSNCPKDSDEYDKYISALEDSGITPVTVRQTADFTLDGVVYTVDPPEKETYSADPSNNSSLIVSVQCGQTSFLFAGDAEDARLGEFLGGENGSYDFLKVPYHGHWQARLPELIASVKPEYAVITSSDKEPEDEETVSALSDAGAAVFLTRSGAVLARSDGVTLSVEYDGA